jgi:hypothetical protein
MIHCFIASASVVLLFNCRRVSLIDLRPIAVLCCQATRRVRFNCQLIGLAKEVYSFSFIILCLFVKVSNDDTIDYYRSCIAHSGIDGLCAAVPPQDSVGIANGRGRR